MFQFAPQGWALSPPQATEIPLFQERERGGLGTPLARTDAFPANSGPATAASYGVYPAFHDPYRLAPYGNVIYKATGYPTSSEYATWHTPQPREPVEVYGPDCGEGWPRSVPAGSSAPFEMWRPAVPYRAI